MDNLRLYNNLASYSADVTRKYPTVSAINEGRGSIRYIRKIATNTSNLPLMNLARAANWVASDATFMTNEDAEKVTDITVSKGIETEGYVLQVESVGLRTIVELVDDVYVGTLSGLNLYLTQSSGEMAFFVNNSSPLAVTILDISDTTTTLTIEGTDYTGYVYTIATPDGNKNIFVVDGVGSLDITDTASMVPCNFMVQNLIYDITYGTAETGGGESMSTYLRSLVTFDEFKYFTSVDYISDNAFYNCTSLTSITIPNTVTEFAPGAFYNCTSLTSITIPNTVTRIASGAFQKCTGLTNITIPNSVTSIDASAFESCSGLTSIEIPNSVTSIPTQCFYGCTGLTSVTIPNSVTSIGTSAFYGCSGLASVTIPNSVTMIGNSAFECCSGLTSITIPNSVTEIGNAVFSTCTNLTTLTIGSSVNTIGSSGFTGCTNLQTITSLATTAPTIQSDTFYNVGVGGTLYYPNGSDYSSWLSKSAFYLGYYRWNLPTVTYIAKYQVTENQATRILNTVDYVQSITIDGNTITSNIPQEYTFSESGLKTVSVSIRDDGSTDSFAGCTALKELIVPDNITQFCFRAFGGCSGLTSITIPSTVKTIKNQSFYQCTALTTVNISDIAAWCDIDITGASADRSPLYYAHNLYINGNRVTDLEIPNSVTAIKSGTFAYCSGLTSVTIPNSVTSIGERAFLNCSGLTSVAIGNSVASIGESAFSGCRGLTSVTIPNSVTDIGTDAFLNCSGLTSVTIPNSVTSIGWSAFRECTSLISVAIPNSMTYIGNHTFFRCTSLTSVTIGNSVTEIGAGAFEECSNLSSITSLATTAPTIKSTTFRSVKTGGTLYYPSGSDYSAWMQTGDYYLGKYNWTAVAQ